MKWKDLIPATLFVALAATSAAHGRPGVQGEDDKQPVTVSIFFIDRIEENESTVPGRRTERSAESWAAQEFEERLVELDERYEVIDGGQHEVLKRARGDFAKLSGEDYKVLHQIAVDQGADFYLVGYAHVIGPKLDRQYIPGRDFWVWTATAKARVFSTDRGKVIATLSKVGVAGDLDRHTGRIAALRRAGGLLAPKFVEKLNRRLDKLDGDRTVTVTVLGCDPVQNVQIKKRLRQLVGQPVKVSYVGDVFTGRTRSAKPADELAAEIYASKFDGFKLKLEEARGDVVRFRIETH